MATVEVRYLSGTTVHLENCESVRCVMERIGSIENRFAIDVNVFELNATNILVADVAPPPIVSVILAREDDVDLEALRDSFRLHCGCKNAAMCALILEKMRSIVPGLDLEYFFPEVGEYEEAGEAWDDELRGNILTATHVGLCTDWMLPMVVGCRDAELARNLIESRADVNYSTHCDPALVVAARRGDAKLVEILLSAGANANITSVEASGDTPLQAGCASCWDVPRSSAGKVEVVKMLLSAKASANQVGREG